jgi:hypothetical protein
MNDFKGKWKDYKDRIITIKEHLGIFLKVEYNTGRGPFSGIDMKIDNNHIIKVNFNDGENPGAGKQVGVLNFNKDKIYWGNDTKWEKVK